MNKIIRKNNRSLFVFVLTGKKNLEDLFFFCPELCCCSIIENWNFCDFKYARHVDAIPRKQK
jgi:hypothetical protein